jgi:hypothetical protein
MSRVLSDHPKRVARKQYRCFYCGQRIAISELHGYRTGVDGGDFWTMRHHPECDDYASKHWDKGDYECHFPGDMERPAKST